MIGLIMIGFACVQIIIALMEIKSVYDDSEEDLWTEVEYPEKARKTYEKTEYREVIQQKEKGEFRHRMTEEEFYEWIKKEQEMRSLNQEN